MITAEDWLTSPNIARRATEQDCIKWIEQIQQDAIAELEHPILSAAAQRCEQLWLHCQSIEKPVTLAQIKAAILNQQQPTIT